MKRINVCLLLLGMFQPSAFSVVAQAQVNQAIVAKFPVTKATADRTDIVTAGSVMDLKQDGLLMFAIDASSKAQLIYKDGKIQPTTPTKLAIACFMGHGSGCSVVHRMFVTGEKIWLIDVTTVSDGVQLTLLSDAIKDQRYMAVLKFPFPKGSTLSGDEAIGLISQVINPEAATDAQAASSPAPAPVPPATPPPVAFAPDAPPPPPTDAPAPAPKSVSIGQTKDQVIANFGPPLSTLNGATKTTFVYKDMKVIFVKGKVTDVQ